MPVYRTGQAVDTSVIVFLGKNSQGIDDRMFAQQPRVESPFSFSEAQTRAVKFVLL